MARNWRPGAPWVPGMVVEKLGPLTCSYQIQMENGQLWKCHVDHLHVLSDMPVALEQSQAPDCDWTTPVTTKQTLEYILNPSETVTEHIYLVNHQLGSEKS